uniref:RRM domain-containing protein n=1 Tax=Salix viminalis TaxID=40686 RepID=A0A6N2LZA7_SALVM
MSLQENLIELFSEVGDHKRYSVHYDRSGRSEGTTEIVFARREDVVSAVSRYNNFQLDDGIASEIYTIKRIVCNFFLILLFLRFLMGELKWVWSNFGF